MNLDKNKKMEAFNKWKNSYRTRSIEIDDMRNSDVFRAYAKHLSTHSVLTYQTAFWRMKDKLQITSPTSNVQLSSLNQLRIKKMVNNLRKMYELRIARAFWMVEKVKKNSSMIKDDSISLNDISDLRNKLFGNSNKQENPTEDLFGNQLQ